MLKEDKALLQLISKIINYFHYICNKKIFKMKKLSIVLLSVFFIGIANVNAQNIFENSSQKEEKKNTKEIKCIKTGKICDATCTLSFNFE